MKARDRFFVDGVSCRVNGETYRVANLGTGGFFAASDHPPRLGQTLVMDLILPNRRACRIVGEVSWINAAGQHPDELPPGFGIRLTRIEPADRDAVEDLLRVSAPVLSPVRTPRDDEPR
jgi:Tfp pilus assembly protein PilZ